MSKTTTRSLPRRGRGTGGFTLVELLVAVAIGMALVLAISLMLVRYEGGRRSLTSLNDSSIGGAYVSYALDRMVRSAGSGFAQSWRNSYGCRLLASRSGTNALPRASAFPSPFTSVPTAVRLAPVVIHAGIGTDSSDVLAIHTGSSGLGESPLRVLNGSANDTALRIPSTVGLRGGDLVMVFQGGNDCMLQEVTSGFTGGADQQLNFGGTYADADIESVRLADMGTVTEAWIAPLGNATGNRPMFQLVGVGPNATLVAHDMLQLDGVDSVVALVDGVADLRARYGVDTNDDGRIDSWQHPGTAPWDAATLLDGSVASRTNLSRIIAVRVGLVIRTSVPERDVVAPATLTLFDDLGGTLTATRTLTTAERQLRWRTLDFTIPLRNVMLAPRP
jgi:type IV pilus assembly protein PilW